MDEDGHWRPPSEWPGEHPPVDGWIRTGSGKWVDPATQSAPTISIDTVLEGAPSPGRPSQNTQVIPDAEPTRTPRPRSLQAQADIRVMLLVGGAVLVAGTVLLMALIGQPSADAIAQPSGTTPPEVVFAAETEEVRAERRLQAARDAPAEASAALAELASVAEASEIPFDESLWQLQPDDCLDRDEQILLARSAAPVEWADDLECVPSTGSWKDEYLGEDITSTIDAEVQSLIPLPVVHTSGADQWTPATRAAYLADTDHPATMLIVLRGGGHNPRSQGPVDWRPSDPATWCGYAVDWIAVKERWELGVSLSERTALSEMLNTCNDAGTNGPHLSSMVIDPIVAPAIERTDGS